MGASSHLQNDEPRLGLRRARLGSGSLQRRRALGLGRRTTLRTTER